MDSATGLSMAAASSCDRKAASARRWPPVGCRNADVQIFFRMAPSPKVRAR